MKQNDIVQVRFRPPVANRVGIELMSIAELLRRVAPGPYSRLQRTDFFSLIGVLSGQTDIMVDFSTHHAKAGAWLVIRPGQVMRYDFSRPWTGSLVVFKPEAIFSGKRGAGIAEADLLRRVEDMACLSLLPAKEHRWMQQNFSLMQADSQLAADMQGRNELLRLQLSSTLLRLSMWQGLQHPDQHAGQPALEHFQRFRQLLETDFSLHHQVSHYAGKLAMSAKTLTRACHLGAGLSAKACIAQRVLLEARRLLAHTTLPVQTIAGSLGFDEASNFVKFFRKESGTTPLAFRRLHAHREVGSASPSP